MFLAKTERSDELYRDLDLWPTADVVAAIVATQQDALRAVATAADRLAVAIEALAGVLRAGGRMAYAGAGSSGLIAAMDAAELLGTYGIAADRTPVILAGGSGLLRAGAEDDTVEAEAAVDAVALGPGDALIAIAASGTTPFTVAALRHAAARGALTVGLACVPATPLLTGSAHAVLIETPPEVVAGSTRMAAGTAQKCALNILSTGVAVRLGHAYRGLMVNMRPDNIKLKRRAVGIVAEAAEVDAGSAERALQAAGWDVKAAVLACGTGLDLGTALERLGHAGGDIRTALANHETA